MNKKNWEEYSKYLSVYNRKTDRVLQHFPLKMIPQIREERRDLREIVELSLLRDRIMNALDTLSEREKRVIILRFGLITGIPLNCRKIGLLIGICKSRIGQIEAKALRKLRHPSRMKIILDPAEFKIKMDDLKEEEKKRQERFANRYDWLWD